MNKSSVKPFSHCAWGWRRGLAPPTRVRCSVITRTAKGTGSDVTGS
jgi:hypothetical protein